MTWGNPCPIIRVSPVSVNAMGSMSSAASLMRLWNNESREKLVWGRELYIDSTQVNANADVDSLTPREAREARAAIQTHLAALFAEEESPQEPQTAAAEVVAASSEG